MALGLTSAMPGTSLTCSWSWPATQNSCLLLGSVRFSLRLTLPIPLWLNQFCTQHFAHGKPIVCPCLHVVHPINRTHTGPKGLLTCMPLSFMMGFQRYSGLRFALGYRLPVTILWAQNQIVFHLIACIVIQSRDLASGSKSTCHAAVQATTHRVSRL